jgi:hypothetical protein
MNMISKYHPFISWISLDVAFGAVLLQLCLAQAFNVSLPFSVSICLFIAVFLIYNLDHLIDARNGQKVGARRLFYEHHFQEIAILCAALIPFFILFALQIPAIILQAGLAHGILILLYLLLVFYFPKLPLKEIVVAFGYAAGVSFAPLLLSEMVPNHYFLVGQLVLIAFVNLLLFSFFDRDQDRENGSQSLSLILGHQATVYLIWSLIVLSLVGAIVCIYFQFFIRFQVIMAFMTVAMAVIIRYDRFFEVKDRFRLIGDGIFLLPGLYLL